MQATFGLRLLEPGSNRTGRHGPGKEVTPGNVTAEITQTLRRIFILNSVSNGRKPMDQAKLIELCTISWLRNDVAIF